MDEREREGAQLALSLHPSVEKSDFFLRIQGVEVGLLPGWENLSGVPRALIGGRTKRPSSFDILDLPFIIQNEPHPTGNKEVSRTTSISFLTSHENASCT
jgi:hypothetical protein